MSDPVDSRQRDERNERASRSVSGQQRDAGWQRGQLLALSPRQELAVVVPLADVGGVGSGGMARVVSGGAVRGNAARRQLQELAVLGADGVPNQQKMRYLAERASTEQEGDDER